jgi:dUTP pyrophosphatase
MKPEIKFTLQPGARLPEYAHDTDSGADLFALECTVIPAKGSGVVETGLCIELPEGYEAQARSRSGLALRYGIQVANSPGTIDQGYRGPIKVILLNHSDVAFRVSAGMRVAQIVIAPYVQGRFSIVTELSESQRGAKGFGSTDTEPDIGGEESLLAKLENAAK